MVSYTFKQPNTMNDIQKYYLTETARWEKVLGIYMMVCTVFILLLAVFFIVFSIVSGTSFLEDEDLGAAWGIILGFVYLLCAALYYFFAMYLLRAGKALKAWAASDSDADLTEGLKNTNSFFKFSGILAIISICGLALAIVVGGVIAIVALV